MGGDSSESSDLASWKEIADYLQVSVRTAQKWEREKRLPVQRMAGAKGRVHADPTELAVWKATQLRHTHRLLSPRFLAPYAVGVTLLLALLGGHALSTRMLDGRRRAPALFRIEFQALIVTDHQGRELWRRVFPEPLAPGEYSAQSMAYHRRVSFVDVNGDSRVETLFVYVPVHPERVPITLFSFSDTGEVLWQYRAVHDEPTAATSRPIFTITNFLVAQLERSRGPDVFVQHCRLPDHSSHVAMLDGQGRLVSDRVLSGHFEHLDVGDVDGDGIRDLLLGGVDTARQQATLIVLSAALVVGARTEVGAATNGVRSGRLKTIAAVHFPRTCVNQRLEEHNQITHVSVSEQGIQVDVAERSGQPAADVVYQLEPDLTLAAAWYSDGMKSLHRQLESSMVLDHALTWEEMDRQKAIELVRYR